MITHDEVDSFLKNFKTKLKIFDVHFSRREKNFQALLDLEITPAKRADYLKNLKVEDYYDDPKQEMSGTETTEYWEFGIDVKGTEVYIKITMGYLNKPVICISFHPAEFSINYPLNVT